jgi:hypothetical protein
MFQRLYDNLQRHRLRRYHHRHHRHPQQLQENQLKMIQILLLTQQEIHIQLV